MIPLEAIAPSFLFVASKGLVLSEERYSRSDFGDAILCMRGPVFSLKFARDRAQLFVDIGGNAVEWHKLEYALEFVDRSVAYHCSQPPDAYALASQLENNWAQIAELFGDRERVHEFTEYAQRKAKSLLKSIFPTS